jgi:hypothetical protein
METTNETYPIVHQVLSVFLFGTEQHRENTRNMIALDSLL